MNATTAFSVFARAVIRKKIAFEIQVPEELSRADGRRAFTALHAEAKTNGIQDMAMDEIDEEIRQVRYEGNKG